MIADEDGVHLGVLFGEPVAPGVKGTRTITKDGPSIYWNDQLTFPVQPAVVADPGAQPPVVNQTSAQATAAFEADQRAQMRALLVKFV